MNKLINLLYGSDDIHTYYMAIPEGCPGKPPVEFPDTSFGDIESKLFELNRQGYGIFYSPNPVKGKRKSDNVTSINAVFIDIDDGRSELPEFPIPPSAIVQTSKQGKWHIYWKVPRLKPEQFRAVQEMLIKYYDSDPAIKDPARLLRIPGYDHNKSTPTKVKLLQVADVAYLPETLIEAHGGLISESKSNEHGLKTLSNLGDLRLYMDWAMSLDAQEGERHKTAQRVANEGVALGATRDQVYTVVQACCTQWDIADRQDGREAELLVRWAFDKIDTSLWNPTLIDLSISRKIKELAESAVDEADVYKNIEVVAKGTPEDLAAFKVDLRKRKITLDTKELNTLIKEERVKQQATQERQLKKRASDEGKVVVFSPSDYDELAQAFDADDMFGCTLRSYRDVWYEYRDGAYHIKSDSEVESTAWKWLADCVVVLRDGIMTKYPVNSAHCSQLLAGLRAHRTVPSELDAPLWLAFRDRNESKYINFTNGLLETTEPHPTLHQHEANYFSTGQLSFAYNKDASCPLFIQTISQWFDGPEREQSIRLLQQITKYLLLGNTDRQKFFLFIGVSRSGKSTLSELIRAMIADSCSTSMATLGSEFGLQPLVGKSLAVLPDAHIGRTDKQIILDRLKGITGCDELSVNRKNKEMISSKITARLLINANELHAFHDPSGALAKRMIPLCFYNSFYTIETLDLLDKLKEELPGIFNWAMQADISKGFSLTHDSLEVVRDLREYSSPEVSFFETTYEFTDDTDETLETTEIFEEYKIWCDEEGIKNRKSKISLFKEFKSGFGKRAEVCRKRVNGERKRVLQGVRRLVKLKNESENRPFEEGKKVGQTPPKTGTAEKQGGFPS